MTTQTMENRSCEGRGELRVAIYARVSSERQAQQCTIISQVEALRQRVSDDGFPLPEHRCYLDDGYSGTTLLRPALERLRDAVHGGELDRVYVLDPDRLARKHAYQVLLVEEFQRHGVDLVFLNHEAVGTTPEQNLLLQMRGSFAEFERANILERCRRGKRSAAQRGSVNVFAAAPYGYRYVSKHEGAGVARFEVIADRAEVVRQIFTWMADERLSINEICRRLTQQGVATPKAAARWERRTVHKILKNPAYYGEARFGRTRHGPRRPQLRAHQRGAPETPRQNLSVYPTEESEQITVPVPPLIDRALFAAVQEQLAENQKRRRQRVEGPRYLLQGLLVCAQCGYAYCGKRIVPSQPRRPTRSYYTCPGTEPGRHGGQRVCGNSAVSMDKLDEAVWADARALLQDPQRLLAEYQRRLTAEPDGAESDEVRRRIGQTRRQLNRLIDAYAAELVTKEEFESRIPRLRQQLVELEKQQTARRAEDGERALLKQLIGDYEKFAQKIQQGLLNPDWSTRREILTGLIKRVEIGTEAVRIVYRISPGPFAKAPAREPLRDCSLRAQGDLGNEFKYAFPRGPWERV